MSKNAAAKASVAASAGLATGSGPPHMKGAMPMNQPDTAAAKHHPDRPPDFRVVLRGYDQIGRAHV
jgi:hypothetical protein